MNYHYSVTGVPARDWANSAEMKTAFPRLAAESVSTADGDGYPLVKSDKGWKVSGVQPSAANTEHADAIVTTASYKSCFRGTHLNTPRKLVIFR